MKPSPSLEQIGSTEQSGSSQRETDYVVNIALVYQDALTEQWASEIRESISHVAGPQAVRCHGWKFSELSKPDVFKQAVSHTLEADVIVVSMLAAQDLPR